MSPKSSEEDDEDDEEELEEEDELDGKEELEAEDELGDDVLGEELGNDVEGEEDDAALWQLAKPNNAIKGRMPKISFCFFMRNLSCEFVTFHYNG